MSQRDCYRNHLSRWSLAQGSENDHPAYLLAVTCPESPIFWGRENDNARLPALLNPTFGLLALLAKGGTSGTRWTLPGGRRGWPEGGVRTRRRSRIDGPISRRYADAIPLGDTGGSTWHTARASSSSCC